MIAESRMTQILYLQRSAAVCQRAILNEVRTGKHRAGCVHAFRLFEQYLVRVESVAAFVPIQ